MAQTQKAICSHVLGAYSSYLVRYEFRGAAYARVRNSARLLHHALPQIDCVNHPVPDFHR